MQEEVENRTVAITTSAAKFTGRLFKAAICKYLEQPEKCQDPEGKQGARKPGCAARETDGEAAHRAESGSFDGGI